MIVIVNQKLRQLVGDYTSAEQRFDRKEKMPGQKWTGQKK
jgi:hypothetical protein